MAAITAAHQVMQHPETVHVLFFVIFLDPLLACESLLRAVVGGTRKA